MLYGKLKAEDGSCTDFMVVGAVGAFELADQMIP